MKEFKVVIPEEYYSVLNFKQDELPGVAVINTGLRGFEPKEVFAWHLSIMLDFENLIENGMPNKDDRTLAENFEDELAPEIIGESIEKPNALYLGRITWNETRELIWRVYNPEPINDLLQEIINEKEYPLEFDYRIDHDKDWKLAEWHLKKHD